MVLRIPSEVDKLFVVLILAWCSLFLCFLSIQVALCFIIMA